MQRKWLVFYISNWNCDQILSCLLCLYACLSVCLPLSVFSLCLCVCLCLPLCLCLPVCVAVSLSLCMPVCLPVSLCFYVFVCPCLFVCTSVRTVRKMFSVNSDFINYMYIAKLKYLGCVLGLPIKVKFHKMFLLVV